MMKHVRDRCAVPGPRHTVAFTRCAPAFSTTVPPMLQISTGVLGISREVAVPHSTNVAGTLLVGLLAQRLR